MTEDLSWIPASWWLKASQHLTRYFRRNRHRYPDMMPMKERMHVEAVARQRQKAAKNR